MIKWQHASLIIARIQRPTTVSIHYVEHVATDVNGMRLCTVVLTTAFQEVNAKSVVMISMSGRLRSENIKMLTKAIVSTGNNGRRNILMVTHMPIACVVTSISDSPHGDTNSA